MSSFQKNLLCSSSVLFLSLISYEILSKEMGRKEIGFLPSHFDSTQLLGLLFFLFPFPFTLSSQIQSKASGNYRVSELEDFGCFIDFFPFHV